MLFKILREDNNLLKKSNKKLISIKIKRIEFLKVNIVFRKIL